MNPNKLKYAPLMATFEGRCLGIPLWTVELIEMVDDTHCNIHVCNGIETNMYGVDESFDTIMERYLTLIRNA